MNNWKRAETVKGNFDRARDFLTEIRFYSVLCKSEHNTFALAYRVLA
jgi:hypothetical protein